MKNTRPLTIVPNLENSSEKSSWRQHLKILLPILGLYLILGFYAIGHQSLWEDEYSSLTRVTSSPIPIWKDGHGFLYFALLWLWLQGGNSESVLRSLSVVLGAGAVCLTYAIGTMLINRRVAALGTALFGTSPFFLWYSQEARYITLMIFSTLLTIYAFRRLMFHRGFVSWLAYGSTALLALFSFVSTLLLTVVQGVYLLLSPARGPLLRKWVVCQVVVFTLFAGWFVNGTHFWQTFMEIKASHEQSFINNPKLFPFSGEFNNVRPAVLPYTFFALSTGFSLGPSPRELYADRTFAPLISYAPVLFILCTLYSGLVVSGLFALGSQRDAAGIFLILWVGVPILGVFGIAKLLNIFYDVRYIAMVLPAYVLVLAAGIARFRRLGVQLLLLGAVLTVHGVALANYYSNPRYAREDTRSAGQFLETAVGPHDVILVVGTVSSLPHYYKGDLQFVNFGMVDGAGRPTPERLREISANHERLWLVQIRPWQVDRAGRVKAALDNSYEIIERHHFPGVDVHGYEIPR